MLVTALDNLGTKRSKRHDTAQIQPNELLTCAFTLYADWTNFLQHRKESVYPIGSKGVSDEHPRQWI